MTALRPLARVAPLAALGVAGFLLGSSCGGGESAPTTVTGLTATRPAPTATRPVAPTRTTPTRAAPTTTEETATEPAATAQEPATTAQEPATTAQEPATTAAEPPTTEPPRTVTTVETQTTVVPAGTTTVSPPPPTTTTVEPASSTSDTPWGWIALALALVGAAVIGLVLSRRRRTKAADWSRRLADLSRRSLLALDDVVAEGSLVTGQVQALGDEARSLESSGPDAPARAAVAFLRARLDDLAAALEADRRLRLGPTPPSEEQLAYSTSLIHHQIEQLQDVLRPADAGQRPT